MAATAHFLTTTITRLELLCRGAVLGRATGFFLKGQERWTIVTNWHVLSGRSPRTAQPRHPSGGVPDICRYFVPKIDMGQLSWREIDIELGDALNGSAKWFEHPLLGRNVDIAVLPLPNGDVGSAKDLLEKEGHDDEMFVDLGGDLFLPGYPLGIHSAGGLPIWKRASLASSLEFGEGISRFFYVDTATRDGMSGAPCLAISNREHYRLDRKNNKMMVVKRPMSWRLLGVYSGRRNPSDSFEAQIGVVWREKLLFDVLQGGTSARISL